MTNIYHVRLQSGRENVVVLFEQDPFKSMSVVCTWPRSTQHLEQHAPDRECGWTHPEWSEAAMLDHAISAHAPAASSKTSPAATGDRVLVDRRDVEHVALSMDDCFSDAEAAVLNQLRAAIGYGPVKKVGRGAGRGWVPDASTTPPPAETPQAFTITEDDLAGPRYSLEDIQKEIVDAWRVEECRRMARVLYDSGFEAILTPAERLLLGLPPRQGGDR